MSALKASQVIPAAPSVLEAPDVTLIAASGKVWIYVPTGRLNGEKKKLYFALGMSHEHAVEFAEELKAMAALVKAGVGSEPISVAAHLRKGERLQ